MSEVKINKLGKLIEIFDEMSTHSITDSKTNIVVQMNDSNSAQTQAKVERDKSLENLLNNLADSNPKISKKPKPKAIKKEKASFAQMLDGLDDKTYSCYFCDKVSFLLITCFHES